MTANQALYGTDAALPALIPLRSGPLTVQYENGFFRYLRWGSDEILRMIYFALRDENWGTLEPIIENEHIQAADGSFALSYDCRYERGGETLFSWEVRAEGTSSGELTVEIDGMAHRTFLKNRAGFCVLHPIDGTAGQPCELLLVGGQRMTTFPRSISPRNPFHHLVGMRWQQASGAWFRLEFEGDTFETEDQRNWTDASFKTFCTPLERPFPVELRAGDRVWQRIRFRPEKTLSSRPAVGREPLTVRLTNETTILPEIGVGASTETRAVGSSIISELQKIGFRHYRIEIYPARPDWETELLFQMSLADDMNVPVRVALHLPEPGQPYLDAFLRTIRHNKLVIKDLLLLSSEQPVTHAHLLTDGLDVIRATLPQTRVGIGTDYNFTELNRNRPESNGFDFVSYAIHPQEHAFDHRSLIENLASQADTVQTARSFADTAIHVSPVTLRRRFNPYAHRSADRVWTNEQKADPRQPSLWAAGWTLGSLKTLAEAGVEAITYYQTVGRQGLMTETGELYPVAVLLAEVQAMQGGRVIRTQVSDPLVCSTLLLENQERRCWFIANHTDQVIHLQLPGRITGGFRITPMPVEKQRLSLSDDGILTIEPFGVWVIG